MFSMKPTKALLVLATLFGDAATAFTSTFTPTVTHLSTTRQKTTKSISKVEKTPSYLYPSLLSSSLLRASLQGDLDNPSNIQVEDSTLVDKVARSITKIVIGSSTTDKNIERIRFNLITLLRVGIPSIIFGISSFFIFPGLALFLASMVNDAGVFAVLSQDSSQFVQNFLTVSGLLFSILIGQTYAFLYQQQEAVFYALFNEVTEAKSLLEQVALVCQGRAMYGKVLESISKYVANDLKQLQADPAILISSRPVDDPLESIMYMTSVGVPSSVYETVRSLRQARAARLGALQRKLPKVHMILLWILAGIELISFPLLGAGTQTLGGYNILTIEGVLFGIMTFGIVLTMRVIGELYRPGGGAYNVDSVLAVMVKGLEEELTERLAGGRQYVTNDGPSAQYEDPTTSSSATTLTSNQQHQITSEGVNNASDKQQELEIKKQGGSLSDVLRTANKAIRFVGRRGRRKNSNDSL